MREYRILCPDGVSVTGFVEEADVRSWASMYREARIEWRSEWLPLAERPQGEPEHVEADCNGLNADGTCPHGYGRTCCQFKRPGCPPPESSQG